MIVERLENCLGEIKERLRKGNKALHAHSGHAEFNKYAITVVFNYGIGIGVYESVNPCQGIKKKEEKPRRVYITHEQLQAIMNTCNNVQRNFLKLLYMTAQRPSDVVAMKWTDIVDGFLRVKQQKTKHKIRINVCGTLYTYLENIPRTSQYIIGKKISYSQLAHGINQKAKELGIDFQLRDIRAKGATDLNKERGLTDAQKLLGHTSATMTENVYIRKDSFGEIAQPVSWWC